MAGAIGNLLDEYLQKEADCGTLLDGVKERIRLLRRHGKDYTSDRSNQSALFAKKQAYAQVRADIDSLLDYL